MKKIPHNIQAIGGFSTIEILIAFSVGIIFLTSAMMVSFSDPTLNQQISLESGQVSALDTVLDTNALATSTNSIGDVLAKLKNNWTATLANTSDTHYTNAPEITDVSPCFKSIENITSWNTLGRNGRSMTFGSGLANMPIAKALGKGGCDPTPPGDWDNPHNPNWTVTPSELDGHGTGVAYANINGTAYALITTEQSGNPSKSDFWVIEVSNQTDPNPVSNMNTGTGLNGIATNGAYAYVIQANETTNKLQVIDLSNPSVPSLIASTTLPQAPTAAPRSIFYYNQRVYIGTQYIPCPGSCSSGQNHEFFVFNVSNPASPSFIGSLNVNHNVNDIYVSGSHAYLAASDNAAELMLIDITNPGAMIHPDTSNKKIDLAGNMDGTSVYVLGNNAYLGRERATGTDFDFYKLNVSNPTSITVLKQKKLNLANNTAVVDMAVQGNYAFLVVSDSNSTFQVWDIASDPTSIVAVSTCSNILNLAKSRALLYHDDVIFVVNDQQAALNILRDNPNACTP